jgi:hypothetical protein
LHRPTLSRTVRTRLADAEYDIDEIEETIDEHDYLTPHGGRRGAGDVLYREDPVLAQTALRYRSIKTTKDSYSYIEAGETATRAGDIFDADGDRDQE